MDLKEYLDSMTPTELETYIANSELEALRAERNTRLAQTDWAALKDVEITQEMLDYRQALRDITVNYSTLMNVVWPILPE